MKNNIIEYCLKKKGSTKEYPFGPDPLVIKIAGKMFALILPDKEDHLLLNLKCDPMIAGNLREQHEAVRPGYHMNKKHWNTIIIDGSLSELDVFAMIDHKCTFYEFYSKGWTFGLHPDRWSPSRASGK